VDRALGQQLLTQLGSSTTLTVNGNQDYAYYNGTSMATPHVAGVAALVWSNNPTCTATEVRNALKNTAVDLDVAGRDDKTGYGLVQAKAASDALAASCSGDTTPPPPTGSNVLENGVTKSSLSANTGEQLSFTMEVPAGATDLTFDMSGGTGDADIYVKFGSAPTSSNYDCRPYKSGNAESCPISSAQAGTYYVNVVAYSGFSGVNLTGSFTEPSTGGGGATGDSSTVTDISVSRRAWKYYTIDVPAGMSTLDFTMSGGTGDADLYIKRGSQPTSSSYDCRPYKNGNNEVCSFTNPTADTWHIGIYGYSAASGVTLQVEYNP
jgi:serine protease